jgi:hypothetical protein
VGSDSEHPADIPDHDGGHRPGTCALDHYRHCSRQDRFGNERVPVAFEAGDRGEQVSRPDAPAIMRHPGHANGPIPLDPTTDAIGELAHG